MDPILIVFIAAVVIAVIVMVRRDRSGALDDVGPLPGIGKSGEGRGDPFGPGGNPPHS